MSKGDGQVCSTSMCYFLLPNIHKAIKPHYKQIKKDHLFSGLRKVGGDGRAEEGGSDLAP